jgi:diphthine-ammonia ligase
MKTLALLSGGKDSIYNMMHCIAHGHVIVGIGHLCPPESVQELDSYMYQSVGHMVLPFVAECLELPLYQRTITGTFKNTDYDYSTCTGDEVEDLFYLVKHVIDNHCPDLEALSVGAICSNYQRIRVEHIAKRLGLSVLSYIWGKDQIDLVTDMMYCGIDAIIIKTATMGLDRKHLGKSLKELFPMLIDLKKKWDINVAGEGGEYESLVLDCPLFKKKRIILEEIDILVHRDTLDAPVNILIPKIIKLVDKEDRSIDWKSYILSRK